MTELCCLFECVLVTNMCVLDPVGSWSALLLAQAMQECSMGWILILKWNRPRCPSFYMDRGYLSRTVLLENSIFTLLHSLS